MESEIENPRHNDGDFSCLKSCLRERIDQQFEIAPHGVEDGAGAAAFLVFFHLGFGFSGGSRSRDLVDKFIGYEVFSLHHLFLGGGPAKDGLDLMDHIV